MGHWNPTGGEKQRLRKALSDAFDENSFDLLITDYFTPQTFPKIAPPGPGRTHEYRIKEVIEFAGMNDWLVDLVAAVRERRPANLEIGGIADDIGLTVVGARLDNPTGSPLEALIQTNAKFIDPVSFRKRLGPLEGQVCWIDINGGGGSGFLVGPDLVLTNDHVIDPLRLGLVSLDHVKCQFDFKQEINGSTFARKKPTEVKLASEWLVDRLPPSQHDWHPDLGNARPEELDYALFRLTEKIGDFPVGGDTIDPDVHPRGWIDINTNSPTLESGNQVFVLQHPNGEPLQLAIGTITEFNPNGTRVRYNANAKNGSSGSPCFNADLQIVALHHAHDPAYPPKWNQAIPFGLISKKWNYPKHN